MCVADLERKDRGGGGRGNDSEEVRGRIGRSHEGGGRSQVEGLTAGPSVVRVAPS